MSIGILALIIVVVVNAIAFLVMWWDKARSRRDGAERISEGLLFFLAAAFGSVGVYAGMFVFRHKTRKWYFLIGIPLVALESAALLYLLIRTFGGGEPWNRVII